MKNLFFLSFLVLFMLSQNLFSQHVVDTKDIPKYLTNAKEMSSPKYTNYYSDSIFWSIAKKNPNILNYVSGGIIPKPQQYKAGVRNSDWSGSNFQPGGTREGCSFDLLVWPLCGATLIQVVQCSDCATYSWSSGGVILSTNSFLLITSLGNYQVQVQNASKTCTSEAMRSITEVGIKVNPVITGNIALCAGQNGTLSATGGASYKWNNGFTGPVLAINSAGTYTVTATDANGCTGSATQVVVMAQPLPKPLVTMTNSPTGGVILTASSAFSYQWSNGATTQSITVTTPGLNTISVIVKNQAGCMSPPSDMKEFFVTECVQPPTPPAVSGLSFNSSIEWNKVTFKVNVPNPNPWVAYSWNFGNGIFGAGMQVVNEYFQAGTYTVTLTVYDNLGNSKTITQNVTIQVAAKPCQEDGLTIKGRKSGAIFYFGEINSQTRVNAPNLPNGAYGWVWSTSNVHQYYTIVQTDGAKVGTHEMYFRYKVDIGNTWQNFCHVIRYTILPGYGAQEDAVENRSSSLDLNPDMNVYPNPTDGPVQIDLSGLPTGVYMINVTDQVGRPQVTTKVIKINNN